MNLQMFSDGCDWVIAESPEEARELWCALYGERVADYMDTEWKPLPMDKVFTRRDEIYNPGSPSRTHTVAEWIASEGKGWLASTEH